MRCAAPPKSREPAPTRPATCVARNRPPSARARRRSCRTPASHVPPHAHRAHSTPSTLRQTARHDPAQDPARRLLRRRLRSELDARRQGAHADPHVPRARDARSSASPIRAALDRVLAADVVSPLDVPGHDNSAMDGWAVRFADLAADADTTLRRVGESFAGKPHAGRVGAGEAVRIFTGAVMPEGADTVVMQERATEVPGGVTVAARAVTKAGQNRRFAGEDLKAGQVVFRAGQRVRPAELGMMASLGIGEVAVYRRLRVAFFSTGDELVSIGAPLGDRPDLRQQPLHAARHADAAGLRDPRPRRRARRSCRSRARLRRGRRGGGRRDHLRRRLGRRGRFRQAAARQARRGAVLEDRDEAGPPAGLRHASAARTSSACPAIRCR